MKGLLIGIVLIIVLGLSGVLLTSQNQPTSTSTATTSSYHATEGDVSFEYHDTYKLEERADSFENNPVRVITLIDKDVVIPDMSEGPPAISLVIVPNQQNIPLEQWVKTKSVSNFQLSQSQTLTPTLVGGEQGLSYTHSGLYESNAVAVAHNGKVYVFSVGSIDPSDALVTDFQNLLKTVQFN